MIKTRFRGENKRKDERLTEGLGETLRNSEVRAIGS